MMFYQKKPKILSFSYCIRCSAKVLIFTLFLLVLTSCQSVSNSSKSASQARQSDGDFSPVVLIPTADGIKTIGNSSINIDISNISEGYIMASYQGNSEQINIQLTGPDGITYLYFISQKDNYTAMPLSSGDGTYMINVYEQVEGDIYSTIFSDTIEVSLNNEFTPFLYANQFVNFTKDTRAIQKGNELAKGCESDLDVTSQIYNYVVENTEYDYEKAATVTSPYYPDVDETLDSRKGICFDYAALMCVMLRTQGIPCKLNIGYANNVYHAWISVYLQSIGWVDQMIQFDGHSWTIMDPTLASTDGDAYDPSKEDYILMFQR